MAERGAKDRVEGLGESESKEKALSNCHLTLISGHLRSEVSTTCGSGWVFGLSICDCRLPIEFKGKGQSEIANRQSAIVRPTRYRRWYWPHTRLDDKWPIWNEQWKMVFLRSTPAKAPSKPLFCRLAPSHV